MKRIGLITLPLTDNYGGILQAVALYTYLKSQGLEVTLINKRTYYSFFKRAVLFFLKIIPFQNIKGVRVRAKKRKYLEPFINQHIKNKTKEVHTTEQLKSIVSCDNYYAIIVGSDQVWRMDYIDDGYSLSYFLDFVESPQIKKISYAASFGKDEFKPCNVQAVAFYLGLFDAVSTREFSGVGICSDLGVNDCKQVLDPTLLVDPGFYLNMIEQEKMFAPSNKKKLLVYVLDSHEYTAHMVNHIYNNLGDDFVRTDVYNKEGMSCFSVVEWLGAFHSADFIITDSFHGVIFSIIFKKQFFAIVNEGRGSSRFESLLTTLGLLDRLIVKDAVPDINNLLMEPIDYAKVDVLLELNKTASRNFIKQSLELC